MIAGLARRFVLGVPVDLLIIDTYSSLVKTENPATPDGVKQLFNKLRGMGMAILVTIHTNSKSEVRGFQSKLDIFYFKLRLFRENARPTTWKVRLPSNMKKCTAAWAQDNEHNQL